MKSLAFELFMWLVLIAAIIFSVNVLSAFVTEAFPNAL